MYVTYSNLNCQQLEGLPIEYRNQAVTMARFVFCLMDYWIDRRATNILKLKIMQML